jgi:hypothetical protein
MKEKAGIFLAIFCFLLYYIGLERCSFFRIDFPCTARNGQITVLFLRAGAGMGLAERRTRHTSKPLTSSGFRRQP